MLIWKVDSAGIAIVPGSSSRLHQLIQLKNHFGTVYFIVNNDGVKQIVLETWRNLSSSYPDLNCLLVCLAGLKLPVFQGLYVLCVAGSQCRGFIKIHNLIS